MQNLQERKDIFAFMGVFSSLIFLLMGQEH